MVNITPVTIWHEGAVKTVSKLDVASNYDDLSSYATFVYRLIEVTEQPEGSSIPNTFMTHLISGQVTMNGQDYIDWDNSNEAAYDYVADKLNLTIVPETV